MTLSIAVVLYTTKGAMRKSKPVTVSLGNKQRSVDRVGSRLDESASNVVRAALRAFDREEAAMDEIMRQKILAS
jgi:antitoxin ParD1/3/4